MKVRLLPSVDADNRCPHTTDERPGLLTQAILRRNKMDVTTISVPREYALNKLEEYSHIQSEKRLQEDTELRRMWKWAADYPLINVAQVLKEQGVRENGHPKLALAKADWETCHFSRWDNDYSSSARYHSKKYAIELPINTYSYPDVLGWFRLQISVPHIPPHLRPDDDLSHYHILFEVEKWTEYPADPFLLRQISGWVFAVIGEWDLTELERSILSGMQK